MPEEDESVGEGEANWKLVPELPLPETVPVFNPFLDTVKLEDINFHPAVPKAQNV
jgi:hypothetical protein